MKTKEQLLQEAALVRGESEAGANTAARVGALLQDMVDASVMAGDETRYVGTVDFGDLDSFAAQDKITAVAGREAPAVYTVTSGGVAVGICTMYTSDESVTLFQHLVVSDPYAISQELPVPDGYRGSFHAYVRMLENGDAGQWECVSPMDTARPYIRDIGHFASLAEAVDGAASLLVSDRKATLIAFTATEGMLPGRVVQSPGEEGGGMQYLLWDGGIYVYGVEQGRPSTNWEPIGAQRLEVDGGNLRMLNLGGDILSSVALSSLLADGSVTAARLADQAVTTAKIKDGSVTSAKLGNGSVSAANLAGNAVTSFSLADKAVSKSKLADAVASALNDGYVRDLGSFSSKDDACAYAARSEIAGDKRAALLLFKAAGATGALLQGRIFQMVNGQSVSMQLLMWDKKLYRRDVTGATGVEGQGTSAFAWEETGAQKLDVNGGNLRMLSYENGVIASVALSSLLANGSVTSAKLADGSVSTGKLANYSVLSAKLAAASVTSEKLAAGAVTVSRMAAGVLPEGVRVDLDGFLALFGHASSITAAELEGVGLGYAALAATKAGRVQQVLMEAAGGDVLVYQISGYNLSDKLRHLGLYRASSLYGRIDSIVDIQLNADGETYTLTTLGL